MPKVIITDSDRQFIKKYFPSLKLKEKGGDRSLAGNFEFTAFFSKKEKIYQLLAPGPNYRKSKYFITDSYEIEINISENANPYREVKNTDQRILNLSSKLNKFPSDLHVYANPPKFKNKLCVAGYFDEEPKIGLVSFICEVILPFFYDQSFYENFGKWPRGEFSHGALGILENYKVKIQNSVSSSDSKDLTQKCIFLLNSFVAQNLDKTSSKAALECLKKKKIKHYWRCFSHQCLHRSIDCHPKAFYGLKILHRNIIKHNLKHLLK